MLRRSTTDRRRRAWTSSLGQSSFFFFVFLRRRLTTLDLRFLLWKKLAKVLLDRFWSARPKSITFFAAHLAESSLRGELACGLLFEVLHRSCSSSWLNRTSSALPSAGFVRRLESLSWKVRLGPQSYSIWCHWRIIQQLGRRAVCSSMESFWGSFRALWKRKHFWAVVFSSFRWNNFAGLGVLKFRWPFVSPRMGVRSARLRWCCEA